MPEYNYKIKKRGCHLFCGGDAVQSAFCGHWFCDTCFAYLLTRFPECPSCLVNLKSHEDAEGSPGGHLADCEYSVCETCQQKLTSKHICMLRDEGSFSCPLTEIGCPAGNMASEKQLVLHMKVAEVLHSKLLATFIAASQEMRQEKDRLQRELELRDEALTSLSQEMRQKIQRELKLQDKELTSLRPALQEMRQKIDRLQKELKLRDEELTSLRACTRCSDCLYLYVNEELSKAQRNLKTTVRQEHETASLKSADFDDQDLLIENSNHDVTVVWKIAQFGQRMTDTQSGKYTSIFSLPFYTGRYGYKMCLHLYILGDGIGKGSHMSLFFVLMKGEFENTWPFTHKVTFKLLNQGNGSDIVDTFQPDPMSTSFRRPRYIASGYPRFVSHVDLNNGGFLMNDTLIIKCVVETKDDAS